MKTTILLPVISLFLFLASCTNPSDKKVNDQTSESSESGVTSTDWQSRYDKLEASDLPDNVIQLIGKEWMLVTAGDESSFNTMTASWGGIGFLWNKPVVYIFIRPERYTFEFIEKSEYFTLSFLGEENRAIHKICGSKSGREVDKVKETGLKPIITEKGNILFEQGRLSLECRKLYTDVMKEDCFIDPSVCKQWYGGAHGGLHHIYVAEITGAWMRE
mgnify:FL=1